MALLMSQRNVSLRSNPMNLHYVRESWLKAAPAHPNENCCMHLVEKKIWNLAEYKKLGSEDGIEGPWERVGAQNGEWERGWKRNEWEQKAHCPLAVL